MTKQEVAPASAAPAPTQSKAPETSTAPASNASKVPQKVSQSHEEPSLAATQQ
jgi:hypothetical protein